MFKRKQSRKTKIDTLIGAKTRIEGDVEFVGGLHLDGYINGNVKGDIEAGDRVELGAKARVLGTVHYTLIETAVGAQINGKLVHRGNSEPGKANSGPATGEPGRKEGSEL